LAVTVWLGEDAPVPSEGLVFSITLPVPLTPLLRFDAAGCVQLLLPVVQPWEKLFPLQAEAVAAVAAVPSGVPLTSTLPVPLLVRFRLMSASDPAAPTATVAGSAVWAFVTLT
jgi:hypothetical protein